MNELHELLDSFTEHLKLRNRSAATIRHYRWHLGKFFAFVQRLDIHDIQDITHDHIRDYQRYRHYYQNRYGRHDSAKAQNMHMLCIKNFFRYLKEEGFFAHDPTEDITYAREPKQLPKAALTNSEVKKLLRQPDTNTLLGFRDRTILELLYSTGLRKSELLNLKPQDVDYGEGFVRVNHGKGDKDRVTPIGAIACRFLETYIKGIRPMLVHTKDTLTLFLNHRGAPLGPCGLEKIITRYARASGIPKHITPHTLRRSCATEMIKHKANLMHVKELLGHSSIDTVQTYCNLAITDLKEAHRKCHPREKDTL